MRNPEERLLGVLKDRGVDFLCTLPCDRVGRLIALSDSYFFRLPLTREEEGVGIAAGAALGGRRPAMILQNSGVGNMVNALLSLTRYYELPLALFVSHRGIYKEGIAAQVPMGAALTGLFEACGIGHTGIDGPDDLDKVGPELESLYRENKIHAFLLSPAVWEDSELRIEYASSGCRCEAINVPGTRANPSPVSTRYDVLKVLAPVLKDNMVVCNLGVPSKELYDLLPQDSNFYMLGSMGMATPIGLGLAMSTDKRVFVIDGDGSLLMNPGSLATVSLALPENLTVLAIDNASYGSTGSQPTLTGTCVDLELVARGFGFTNTRKAASKEEILEAVRTGEEGPKFIHIPALPGNAKVPNIPLEALEIKRREKFIGNSLEASVTLHITEKELLSLLSRHESDLPTLFIVSQATIESSGHGEHKAEEIDGLSISVTRAQGNKCQRCWKILPDVGTHAHDGVCGRCNDALGGAG